MIALALISTQASSQEGSSGKAAASAGYKEGFFIRSDDGLFSLKASFSGQLRLDLEQPDEEDADLEGAFRIRRGRAVFSGKALDPAIGWKLQLGFEQGDVSLKDLYADYTVSEDLRLRAGQWKRPFSRQFLNSGFNQELIDRAITHNSFAISRDIGLAIHNGTPSGLEYALGVFNGTGDGARLSGKAAVDPTTGEGDIVGGKFSNVPKRLHPMVVGRLAWNQEGMDGYSEADLKGGDLRVAVGASALADFDGDNDDASTLQAEVDFALKAHGFSATGAAYAATAQTDGSVKSQELDATGFHVQIGQVFAQMFEPALRFALVAPEGPDNDRREITLGFSVFIYEHDLKLQLDASQLSNQSPDGDVADLRVRTQLQLAF